ncbi:MAG TPA: glutamate cyclase domain-containing protein [Planctomycetaceae bacterium]|nr:glutamate cyclase domain-containing protein [Planctomycetaceae bacterium]
MSDPRLAELERLIRRDPGRRGLISAEETLPPLCPGHLAGATEALLNSEGPVWIVTGFYIPAANPPAAETDGPPGAAFLAAILQQLGRPVRVVTDDHCRPVVAGALRAADLDPSLLLSCPVDPAEGTEWCRDQFADSPPGLLLAIERVGPSHTLDSLSGQPRSGLAPRDDFQARVPAETWDHCHNMRGVCIDAHTAPLHRLFESASERGAPTIGIGDGGNEIGMGTVPWEELVARLAGEHSARIPCRIATDWTVLAGVSNWGGFALAAAAAVLAGRPEILRGWTAERHYAALQRLVSDTGAVDGVTRMPEATVDGLPFETYIQPWEGMRRVLGFA